MRALFGHGAAFLADHYGALLEAQYHVHASWERRRAAWLCRIGDRDVWHYQSRLPALQADLAEWHADAPTVVDAADDGDGEGNSDDAAWGELYVIEGASLGGQLIARRLGERFADASHHFFGLGRDRPGDHWRQFQQVLDLQLSQPAAQRRAIHGAREMFGRFQSVFEAIAL